MGTSPKVADFHRYQAIRPSIEGWFSHEAAAIWWILLSHQASAGVHGDLLEIGVWRGKAALLLALQARKSEGERCVLVDKYLRLPSLEYQLARVGILADGDIRFVECDARRLRERSDVMASRRGYRWIHADEEHSAEAVTEDLALAEELLCEGGILCINAYMSSTHPQVTSAILRYVEDERGGLRMFLGGFDKAYLTTRAAFRDSMELCHRHLIPQMEALGAYATLTKKTRAGSLNFFGICDRFGDRRLIGLDGDDERIEY